MAKNIGGLYMHKHDDNSTVISPFGRGEPGDGEAIRKS